MSIVSGVAGVAVGFIVGRAFEGLRYSIIFHNAQKGDAESKAIMDELDEVGAWIENKFTK